MSALIDAIVLGLGGIISIVVFILGLRILSADTACYQQNYERSKRFRDVLFGRVRTKHNGTRDFRVRAGLVVNRNNQWEEQGTLSEEAVDSVLAGK